MQVNSVNSFNFKGNYGLAETEDKSENLSYIDAAREIENMLPDKFVTKIDEDGNEVKTKSAVGTVLSIVGAALLSFALCRKFLAKGAKEIENIMSNEKAQKAVNSVKDFVSKNAKEIGEKIQKSEKASKIATNLLNGKVANGAIKVANSVKGAIDKVGVKNVLAGIGGVAGATYVSKTDSNNDGIADIAQKGINAYKGTVERMGVIGEAIKALS